MSWDISLFNAPPGMTIEEIPHDYKPAPLGSVAEILDRLQAAFVDLNLSDPSWGDLVRPGWAIEFRDGWADFQAFCDRAVGQGAATRNTEQ
ncbi:hypothetical protein [Promicromonospora sukumoe]|uniref:hypothetical protein n=1 Tax=Promicromonospora sukumoe TaxID=88382 RepID=UPI00037A96AA|nr:hypothetical protein [Promicromonospora sukumoe]